MALQTLVSQLKEEVFSKKDPDEVEIKILNAGSDDHYLSDVIFAEANLKDNNGKVKKLDLVIKCGVIGEQFREHLPIGSAFQTEIEIYTKILPRYHKLQIEKSCPLFSSIPRCYFAKLSNPTETIVMENLRPQGYSVHEKSIPLDLNHLHVMLKAYAEWHALSFALKDQKPQEYAELTKNLDESPFKNFFRTMFGTLLDHTQNQLFVMLEEKGEVELLQKYKNLLGNEKGSIVLEKVVDEPEEVSVVLHGDCWNNNLMFKYEEGKPVKAAMIDFQLSATKSPTLDISHFIYVVTSRKQLQHLGDLLHFYHQNLSEQLQKLGSDPKKLFPLELFKSHWKKYSIYGAVLGTVMTVFCLADEELTLDLLNEEKLLEVLPQIMAKEEFYERVLSIIKTFVEFDF